MTFIVAEAGVNHNGSVDAALRLVEAAKGARADAVKFQMFTSRGLWGDERIRHLELLPDDYPRLADYCGECEIEFMCTPFDAWTVAYLAPLLRRVKIASGCITRTALLRAARDTKLPVILSTGMATYAEIRAALGVLGREHTTLLHCTSAYPCPLDQVNLQAMSAMRMLGCPVGYSDHTEGIIVAMAAAAKGAAVIEKHLTLDRSAEGPDHKTSIEPHSFKIMVESIRQIEKALGTVEKGVQSAEVELHKLWRSND